MNIFALDTNPATCAKMHMDKHVVKMPLETAQMLCTVNRLMGNEEVPYKATHPNHPCTVWARESSSNYEWLVALGLSLCAEYTHRYNKKHACEEIIIGLSKAPSSIKKSRLTSFAQALPDDCRDANPITAYRSYYNKHKRHIASWRNREVPSFYMAEV